MTFLDHIAYQIGIFLLSQFARILYNRYRIIDTI